tara:strand:+ start:1005 stop:1271 length:267 start_codon:yes stop_codon:yes gene_type:complete
MNNTTKTMDNKIMANNKYVGHYVDDTGVVDEHFTLNEDGFVELSEDLEAIIEKFTGIEGYIMGGDRGAEIREDLMDLIHELVNGEEEV